MQSSLLAALPWPLTVIDFEASSLDSNGYPIEVGLALWPAPDEPIRGWSALIRPAEDWIRHGHWSPASAKVHGIRGSDLLARGQPAARIAAALNAALGPGIAWCDGGPYDAHWTRALFKAGGVRPTFTLGDWPRLAAMLGAATRARALDWLKIAPTRHRARDDAEQLLLALAHAAEVEVGPVQDLAPHLPALAALAMPDDGAPQRTAATHPALDAADEKPAYPPRCPPRPPVPSQPTAPTSATRTPSTTAASSKS